VPDRGSARGGAGSRGIGRCPRGPPASKASTATGRFLWRRPRRRIPRGSSEGAPALAGRALRPAC